MIGIERSSLPVTASAARQAGFWRRLGIGRLFDRRRRLAPRGGFALHGLERRTRTDEGSAYVSVRPRAGDVESDHLAVEPDDRPAAVFPAGGRCPCWMADGNPSRRALSSPPSWFLKDAALRIAGDPAEAHGNLDRRPSSRRILIVTTSPEWKAGQATPCSSARLRTAFPAASKITSPTFSPL